MVQSIEAVQSRAQSAFRVPPHNLEAEESLLGAMMLSRDAVMTALELKLDPGDFYQPNHGHICAAILALNHENAPVDPVTVAEELRRRELLDAVGGRSHLLSLQSQTPASANAAHYARIVTQLAILRRLISVATEIAEMGYEPDSEVAEVVDRAESLIFEVAERQVSDSMVHLYGVLEHTLDDLEAMYKRQSHLIGVASGYTDLDNLLLGFQRNALLIVAARPGQGKTSFALGAAKHVAMAEQKPVLFFSMEMGHLELTKRLLAAEARVNARNISTGKLDDAEWPRLNNAVGRLAKAPFYIDDNPHCTIMEMRAKARRLKARSGDLGLIVIDYLQLMSSGKRVESRQVEVSELSRGLKLLARELECPVMALSQLNRQVEYRTDKRPMLADLRESGSLEQDADAVMFIYRDDYYNPDSEQRGTAEVIVAKHRNGPTGMARLAFVDKYTLFANMARE